MIGRIVSAKLKNSATVLLESRKLHPLYKKSFVSTKKYLVDDSLGVKEGDIVEFVKCRPISKNKHWKITKILGQDVVALGTQQMQQRAEEAIEAVLPEERPQLDKKIGESKEDKKIKDDKKKSLEKK